jgi:pyrroline-5-carboxylate reductase
MSSSSARPASLADLTGTLMLVGAGKMGGALLEGWLEMGLDPARLVVFEPQPSAALSALAARGLRLNPAPEAVDAATAIVVAVKPQIAADALATIAPRVQAGSLVVSIMAGRTLAFLQSALPGKAAVVRAMPNTPAAIGRGITVAVANAHLADRQRELAHRLLAATGAVEWVENEGLMDAVTAVSGSGPAYVFLLAECLARAGIAAGLPAGLAERLAHATVAGSGELMARSSAGATALRQAVTSPGGTTAAALEILMAPNGLSALMEAAVAAATRRSRELAG